MMWPKAGSACGPSNPAPGSTLNRDDQKRGAAISFRLDVRCRDDWLPLRDLGLVIGRKSLRRLLLARRKLLAEIGEMLPHGRVGQGLNDRRIELRERVLRRIPRRPKPMP